MQLTKCVGLADVWRTHARKREFPWTVTSRKNRMDVNVSEHATGHIRVMRHGLEAGYSREAAVPRNAVGNLPFPTAGVNTAELSIVQFPTAGDLTTARNGSLIECP